MLVVLGWHLTSICLSFVFCFRCFTGRTSIGCQYLPELFFARVFGAADEQELSTLIRLHAAPPRHRCDHGGKRCRMAADRVLDNVLGTPNMGVWQDGGNRITR